jgi:5-methylcytosine-specific restriction endonuclease McrA
MPVIDKTKWNDEELMVFEEYRYLCVLCGFQLADTLHHEPPRSLNPNWKDEPWTQFPLCAAHHDFVTTMSRSDAEEMILAHVDVFATGAIERIKDRVALAR